jgi:hypothetical protein
MDSGNNMNTSQLLSEITRLYVSPSERGSALADLLKNIQESYVSLSTNKLESCRLILTNRIEDKNLPISEDNLISDILNLIGYYISESQPHSDTPATEAALYENIYYSFGKFLMHSVGRQSQSEPTLTDIRIFLVLSGLSRKAIYPEHILKSRDS